MNSLGIDLTDKTVIIKRAVFPGRHISARVFKLAGGFGCVPYTIGSAIIGEFLHSGEKCRLEGHDVMRLAKEADIEKAQAIRTGAASPTEAD